MSSGGREHARVPERPLLAPWVQAAVEPGRALLRDGDVAVVLEGTAAERLLPSLLPLLDGERTVEELAVGFGEAVAPAVRNALGVLAAHNLLVEGPAPALDLARACAASALAQAGLAGGVPAAAAHALARARVAVVGEGPVALLAGALVAASGPVVERVSLAGAAACRGDLAVVAPGPEERRLLAAADAAFRDAGRTWLAVPGRDGPRTLVGPIVVPGASCCWECVRQRRAAASGFGDAWPALEAVAPLPLTGATAALAAAVAAQLVVGALADGVGVAVPAGVLWAVEGVPEPAITRHVVHRVPRCPSCSAAAALPQLLPWAAEGAA